MTDNHREEKDLTCHTKHCLNVKFNHKQYDLTSMTQNRNFSGTFNTRDKFVAASWNNQINYIIKLEDKTQISTLV